MNICLNLLKKLTEYIDMHTLIPLLWTIFGQTKNKLWAEFIIQKLFIEQENIFPEDLSIDSNNISSKDLLENNKISVKYDFSNLPLEKKNYRWYHLLWLKITKF